MQRDGAKETIERLVDSGALGWPSEEELVEEDYFNRGYQDLRGLDWDDAREVLQLERVIIGRGSGDLTAATESMSDSECTRLGDLDLGVASAVVALSAAKCAPISSCNGSPGHNEMYPVVAFYCRKGRVRDVLKVAELTDCGLCNGDSGVLILHAGTVQKLLSFAEVLIERRDRLRPLSRPRLARRSPSSPLGDRPVQT